MRGLYVAENEASLKNEWSCYLPQVLCIFFSRGVPNFKFHQIPRKRTPPKTNSSHKPSRIHQTPQNGLENKGIPSKFPHRNALFDPKMDDFRTKLGVPLLLWGAFRRFSWKPKRCPNDLARSAAARRICVAVWRSVKLDVCGICEQVHWKIPTFSIPDINSEIVEDEHFKNKR